MTVSRRSPALPAIVLALAVASTAPAAEVLRVAGPDAPGFAALDDAMGAFLRTNGVPRAQLAVVRGGRLVFDHAYTWAEAGAAPTQPTNRFRIASLSKPVTAIAVHRLAEDGRLRLDDPVAPLVGAGDARDPRWRDIRVVDLLRHRAGFDSAASGDPMFRDRAIAEEFHVPLPVGIPTIVAHMKRRDLDFAPGTRHAYSNFGYLLLGRVIEKASGTPYAAFVDEAVFRRAGVPAGVAATGESRPGARLPGEVEPVQPDVGRVPSVFGAGDAAVCEGGFNLANMDAHGGIVCTASALAREGAALDEAKDGPLLKASSVASMWSRPDGEPADSKAFYASGWLVRPVGGGRANAWHNGSLPGTRSLWVRLADGTSWAVLLNQREKQGQADFALALDVGINRVLAGIPRAP